MIVRERFPMSEVVARTGVPAATVHHYRRLGLLPPPGRAASNRFLYDERHVLALRLIRTLRDRRRLSLPAIRRVLPDLLGLEGDQAFRPDMWDRAVGLHLRRDRRRAPEARILEAAKEAFARRGYEDVGVDDVCRAARVAKGSFYRHFRSKEELFFAVCESAGAEVSETFAAEIGPRPAPRERAVSVLADLLEPRLPIFLELVARTIQRRPGYRGVARRILGGLAYELGELSGAAEGRLEAGTDVIQGALGRILATLLTPEPLGVERTPARA